MRALACLLAIAFATTGVTSHARAQAPDRGYGGPETVGPNFSTGKQSDPPDYGNGPPKQKSYSKPQPTKKAKPGKPDVKAAQAGAQAGPDCKDRTRHDGHRTERHRRYPRDRDFDRRRQRIDRRKNSNVPPLRCHHQHHPRSALRLNTDTLHLGSLRDEPDTLADFFCRGSS